MKRNGFSDVELGELSAKVGRIILAHGMPLGSVSNFATKPALCKIHSDAIRAYLRLPNDVCVWVVHCGCDHWLTPVVPPPRDIVGIAQALAEEIVWYRLRIEDTIMMLVAAREAVDREIDKAAFQGLNWRPAKISLGDFETFRGRRLATRVTLNLLDNNLLPISWDQPFWTLAEIPKFFRSMRPFQFALAKRRDELAKVGAIGAIDMVALAAICHAQMDPLKVIAEVTQSTSGLWLDLADTTLSLSWRMGTVEGKLDLAPGVRWEFGEIRFDKHVAPTRDTRTHEQLIRKFVASSLLPEHALVRCTSTSRSGEMTLSINPPTKLFGLAGGKVIWI